MLEMTDEKTLRNGWSMTVETAVHVEHKDEILRLYRGRIVHCVPEVKVSLSFPRGINPSNSLFTFNWYLSQMMSI